MARAWWLLTLLACACSSGGDKSSSHAAGWLSITLNAATVEFDCPLLIDPSDATSGCGVRGGVSFENCATE